MDKEIKKKKKNILQIRDSSPPTVVFHVGLFISIWYFHFFLFFRGPNRI